MAGKWLEVLTEISPRVKRIAFLLHPEHPAWAGYLRTVKEAASSLDVEVIPAGIRDAGEIERVIDSFAREPNGGLFVLPDLFTYVHRELIIALAARHLLPTIYPFRYFPAAGGLMSYGADRWICSDERPHTSTASSRVRNPPTCRSRRPPSTSW
jgi:putative ABC transport system substrate-binding protein